MTEDDPSGNSLISIDDLFKKRYLRNTTIADLAIMSLQPLIEQLETKTRIFVLGTSITDGGNYSGSIRTLGHLITNNMVITYNLNVTGNVEVADLLLVRDRTTIAGNTTIRYNAVFGDKTLLAGRVNIGENIISSRSITLAGKVHVGGQIISDGDIITKSDVSVSKIQTLGHLRSLGTLEVEQGIRANSVSLLDPKCKVYGDIVASKIGIGREKHLRRYITNYDADKSLKNPIELVKFLFATIIQSVRGVKGKELVTEIEGDLIAEDLFLENCKITGNINAKRITIGDNVEIKGEIEFSESIDILTDMEYEANKISSSDLKYLPLVPDDIDQEHTDALEEA